jgi:transposase
VSDGILLAETLEQRGERREPVLDCRAAEFAPAQLVAPSDEMCARHDAEFLWAPDAGEAHKILHGVFVDVSGVRVGEVLNPIFYVLRSVCPWRQLPTDLPPWSSPYRWFAYWRDVCLFERINHALVMQDRERAGRQAGLSAAIIDSQSVKATEAGGTRGFDAGKNIKGRKRHVLVDTDGRALLIEPHSANIQDRNGGAALLQMYRSILPFIERVFGDGGYIGKRVANATAIIVEIVRKQPDQAVFFPYRGAGWSNASSPSS